jgi:hypothetical protein
MALVSSGFIARLDFGELARWGRMGEAEIRGARFENREIRISHLAPRFLALALLVLGVLADDANDTATVNHLALVADLLY